MRADIAASAQDRFIDEDECKDITNYSRTRRWELEKLGLFPKRRQLGEHKIGWLKSEIDDWIKSRPISGPLHGL